MSQSNAPRKLGFTPDPDYGRIDKVLRRSGKPDRAPLFELFSNIQNDVLQQVYLPDERIEKLFMSMDARDEGYKDHIRYMYTLGYDYINMMADNFAFPMKEMKHTQTKEGDRAYVNSESVTLMNWQDFGSYRWPVMADVDYSRFERAPSFLPDGMKIIAWESGVLENVMWLLGYEGISYWLADDEQLVARTFEAVGSRMVEYYDAVASFDCVGAIGMGEDMGFNTATMLSPETYRKYLFPYHRQIAENAHRHGKPAFLHSCGNLKEIMGDVIRCGWDAKHSFEDAIEPVWEAQQKYGNNLAMLGGFDLDKLTRMNEDEVRQHARFLIDTCGSSGGWAMGTGNSVPQYIPVGNFLAMVEENFR